MQLKTERLLLTEITWDDLEDIFKLHSTPEVDEYNTLGIPKNIEVTKEVIKPAIENQQQEKRNLFCWSIKLREDNTFIGLCGMSLSVERFKMGEIYYNLHPDYWGKGYATETAKALVNFGFIDLQLHRVEAGVATENTRSIHVLEKLGMTREGTRRKILPIRGIWKDNYHYAIVEDDKRDY